MARGVHWGVGGHLVEDVCRPQREGVTNICRRLRSAELRGL